MYVCVHAFARMRARSDRVAVVNPAPRLRAACAPRVPATGPTPAPSACHSGRVVRGAAAARDVVRSLPALRRRPCRVHHARMHPRLQWPRSSCMHLPATTCDRGFAQPCMRACMHVNKGGGETSGHEWRPIRSCARVSAPPTQLTTPLARTEHRRPQRTHAPTRARWPPRPRARSSAVAPAASPCLASACESAGRRTKARAGRRRVATGGKRCASSEGRERAHVHAAAASRSGIR